MRSMKWVTSGFFAVAIGQGVAGCSPSVTVSRDDMAGQAGTAGTGVSGAGGGSGGTNPEQGGAGVGPSVGGTFGVAGTGGVGNEGGDDGVGGSGGTAGVPSGCPCTRRPGAIPSRNCPRGSGSSQSATIGPDGGIVGIYGSFSANVFAGSLPAPTALTITELTAPPPEELVDVSPIYRLEPDGIDFVNGGEVTVPWTVPSGLVPEGIVIYFSESVDGPYAPLTDTYQNAGFSQATLLRSGYFLTAYPRTEEHQNCP